ncbi:MAG: Putative fluoride ion transporter CrcB [Owenweeksia sp. TMED14]|nr:MAG: Putative fluoride ion transporter CrcB [Owenweeksia sp. TMED14]
MGQIIAIFIGGGVGSLARYAIGEAMHFSFPGSSRSLIFGTLLANIIACLILGYLLSREIQPKYIALLGISFCGGFSTFSTFSNEVLGLIKSGQYSLVAVYLIFSIGLGMCALIVGSKLS